MDDFLWRGRGPAELLAAAGRKVGIEVVGVIVRDLPVPAPDQRAGIPFEVYKVGGLVCLSADVLSRPDIERFCEDMGDAVRAYFGLDREQRAALAAGSRKRRRR